MNVQSNGSVMVGVLAVLVLLALVAPILGWGMMAWGVPGPGSCSYWPGA